MPVGLNLFGLLGGTRLYPFEVAILDAVLLRMSEGARHKLKLQIDAVNKVQRINDGKEVNLYKVCFGKAIFDEHLRFPNAPDEMLLASTKIKLPHENATLKVSVWMADGRLFSLEYSGSPMKFFGSISLTEARPEIVDVEIMCDPL